MAFQFHRWKKAIIKYRASDFKPAQIKAALEQLPEALNPKQLTEIQLHRSWIRGSDTAILKDVFTPKIVEVPVTFEQKIQPDLTSLLQLALNKVQSLTKAGHQSQPLQPPPSVKPKVTHEKAPSLADAFEESPWGNKINHFYPSRSD